MFEIVLTGGVVKIAHNKQQSLSTEMTIGGALTQQPVSSFARFVICALHIIVSFLS